MAGIYVHIPFCRKACHYCNFHFSTSRHYIKETIEAINMEAVLRKDYLQEPVDTIYFGGGTPSLLEVNILEELLTTLKTNFSVSGHAEITLEANPDDVQKEKAEAWRRIGINRLSIGIQSFYEEDLVWMNRAHNAAQAKESIEIVRGAGFEQLTIDLIYGGPTLSDERWQRNVELAISLGIPHLSCYALTVEPQTPLDKMIHQQKKENIDQEKQSRQFEQLMIWMKAAGYEHYEISNFCKPGHRSKHNTSYWQGTAYLGLGPSAHSFNGSSRQWNVANNNIYFKSISNREIPFEIEYLTDTQQLNEYIMTRLRRIEGLSLELLRNKSQATGILMDAQAWIKKKHLVIENDSLKLTDQGKLFADAIAASLFR